MLIRPGHFTLEQLQAVHAGGVALELDAEAYAAIAASAAVVQRAAAGDAPVYGVNTGFGKLASTRISAADLATLQLNLIRSHSVGVASRWRPRWCGWCWPAAGSLARGASGVRHRWCGHAAGHVERRLVPVIPARVRWAPQATWRRWPT